MVILEINKNTRSVGGDFVWKTQIVSPDFSIVMPIRSGRNVLQIKKLPVYFNYFMWNIIRKCCGFVCLKPKANGLVCGRQNPMVFIFSHFIPENAPTICSSETTKFIDHNFSQI
jgi:hypothetical protein